MYRGMTEMEKMEYLVSQGFQYAKYIVDARECKNKCEEALIYKKDIETRIIIAKEYVKGDEINSITTDNVNAILSDLVLDRKRAILDFESKLNDIEKQTGHIFNITTFLNRKKLDQINSSNKDGNNK